MKKQTTLKEKEKNYFVSKKGKLFFGLDPISFLFYPETIATLNEYHKTEENARENLMSKLIAFLSEESVECRKSLLSRIKNILFPCKKPPKDLIELLLDKNCVFLSFPGTNVCGVWKAKEKKHYSEQMKEIIIKREEFRKKALFSLVPSCDKGNNFFIQTKKEAEKNNEALFLPFPLKPNTVLNNFNPMSGLKKQSFLSDCPRKRLFVEKAFKKKRTFVVGLETEEAPLSVRLKLIQFHTDYRPPYYGSKKNLFSTNKRNTVRKHNMIDYTIESDDEWQDDIDGEAIESEIESFADECEVFDDFLVPDGYLSEDEGIETEGVTSRTKIKVPSKQNLVCIGPYFEKEKNENTLKKYSICSFKQKQFPLDPFLGAEVCFKEKKKTELTETNKRGLVEAILKTPSSITGILSEFKANQEAKNLSDRFIKKEIQTLALWERRGQDTSKKWYLKEN